MGGRASSAGVESKLQPNSESYKNQLLGMWIEFSLDDFHENTLFFSVTVPFPPMDPGLLSHKIEKTLNLDIFASGNANALKLSGTFSCVIVSSTAKFCMFWKIRTWFFTIITKFVYQK